MTDIERVKPRSVYVEEAIQAALESRWKDAVALNRALLEKYGPDEDTYNRLGKALSELGDLQGALDAYRKTLEINPHNTIAEKNVRRLSALLETAAPVASTQAAIDVDLFTEEPGKSALTVLTPPEEKIVVTVDPGDPVELVPVGNTLVARTARGVDLGSVDTKIARRLLPLMATGNRYTAAVARVEDSRIEIIIREVFQAPENARKTSFPIARPVRREEYRPYAKESLLVGREVDRDLLEEGEEEEALVPEPTDLEEDLEGMQTLEGDLEEVAVEEVLEDELIDEDVRPEDEY